MSAHTPGPSSDDARLIVELLAEILEIRKLCEKEMLSGRCDHARAFAKAILRIATGGSHEG